MQSEQVNFEHEKEQIDDKYFQLAAGVAARKDSVVVAGVKVDSKKVKPADTIKSWCATLKLSSTEFQEWAAKTKGLVEQSNFLAAEVNVQRLFMNAVLDKETQQKVESMPEQATAYAFEVL